MGRIIQTALSSFGMSSLVFHGPSLKINSNFRIKKILERSKNISTEKHPESLIVRSFEDILNDPEIELVIINTPDTLHYKMCKKALEAGKNIVVEKPFTQTIEEADELIKLAHNKKLLLTVYQNRRLDSDFLTVRKILDDKLLGRLVEFESHFDRYRNFIQSNTWKEDAGDKSGVLYNLGSHMIDQALTLFGMPKSVTAHLDILRDNGQAKDYYDIRLQHDGFAAILKSSYLVRESGPRYSMHGTLGSFHKWGIDPQEQALKDGRLPNEPNWGSEPESNWGLINYETEDGLIQKNKIETIAGNYGAFYENLYEVLTNGAELLVKPEESRDGLKILEACMLSDKEKRTVFIK